jgi:glycosyltransferase involved in cell wall biosynthesis
VISNAGPHPWFTTLVEDGRAPRENLVVGSVGPPGPLQADMTRLGVRTFALGAQTRAAFPRAAVQLASRLRSQRTEVVQAHLVDGCLVGLAAARLARVPVRIMMGHHSHELPFHGRRLRWPDKLCAGPLSNHIIAPSRDVADTMVHHLGVAADKVEVVHHGFNLSRLDPARADGAGVRRELGLNESVVLGSIGRLYRVKNQEALLRAFQGVTSDAKLVLAGPGDQTRLRRLAAELGVSDRVVLPGPRHDVPELLAAFDLFVHPAIAESFGMVIIEAMAMELPVMSTPVGIAREVVDGSTGVLADSPSVDDLRSAINRLLAQRARWPTMGAAARERILGFTAQTMAARYGELYERWLAT